MQEAKPISTYIPDPLDLPVDLIIADRFRQSDDQGRISEDEEEFLVKLKGQSYLEVEWLTEQDFLSLSPNCQNRLKRYKVKREKLKSGLA
jgi:hypothetical protein